MRSLRIAGLLLLAAAACMAQAPSRFLVCAPEAGQAAWKAAWEARGKSGKEPKYPSFATALMEVRDPEGALWPSFAYGRSVGEGEFADDAGEPRGAFTLAFDGLVQGGGDPSRRALGGLVRDGKLPAVTFTLKSLGKPAVEQVAGKDKRGREISTEERVIPADGVLSLGGKQVPVQARLTTKRPAPGEGPDREGIYLSLRFTLTGTQLGLAGDRAGKTFQVRLGVTGYPAEPK